MKILKIFTKYRITELNLYKTFANQLVVSISNFISTILVLRILGLENFGIFSIAWSILLLTNNILHAVFITPLLNIAPKLNNDEKQNEEDDMADNHDNYSMLGRRQDTLRVEFLQIDTVKLP